MKCNRNLFCLLVIFCLMLTGCAGITPATSGSSQKNTAQKDSFHVVTSFYPMYVATINITHGIDGVSVTNMTKPQTGCLHDYQLTTQDMKTLESADAFVVNGAGMESFLDKVIQKQKNLKIIDASKNIELLSENGEQNPHVWLSVTAAIQQVKNITEQLKAADPQHADAYQANSDIYVTKLEALKKEMHAALDQVPNKDIVTFHEAFPYFAKEFGLNIISVIEREPGTEPTPTELENTIRQVNALPVKILFTEPQYSPSSAQTIARETGASIYALDPIVTGKADESALNAYIDIMHQNMDTLRKALQ